MPGIMPEGGESFRVGDPIRLKRPDGSELDWRIGGLEMICASPPRHDVVILIVGLTKVDVPVGTEVWSIDPS